VPKEPAARCCGNYVRSILVDSTPTRDTDYIACPDCGHGTALLTSACLFPRQNGGARGAPGRFSIILNGQRLEGLRDEQREMESFCMMCGSTIMSSQRLSAMIDGGE
jgi:DNA-directed RNA polymerase subunit RPC12/RpoP